MLRTYDGGENWQNLTSGDDSETITGIQFVDSLTGWIIGNKFLSQGFVRKTVNGGTTWGFKFLTDNQLIFKKFFFKNNNQGFIPSFQGKIYTTNDGGDTWNTISIVPNKWLTSVHFSNQENGWLVGDRGVIAKTSDGGINWVTVSKGIKDENFQAIKFIDTLTGWYINNKVGVKGSILKTDTGGDTWVNQLTDTLVNFLSLDFISHTTGWVAGSENWTEGIYYKTSDGGINWAKKTFDSYYMISSLDFVDSLTGWMIGNRGLNSYFLKTTDGGNLWNIQFEDSSYQSKRIKFFDYLNGWAFGWPTGGSRYILRTTDGGLSWNAHPADDSSPIYDLSFISPMVGWVAGGIEIFGNDPESGEGIISYTSDGGVNWQRQLYIERDAFNSLDFIDDLNGWAVGYNGQIYNTTTGGSNWSAQWIPTGMNVLSPNLSFYSVDFVNPKYGWICGNNGAIFKTHSGGEITGMENKFNFNSDIPEEFFLQQNYPNPFNNQTIISYTLKQKQLITLSIYDLLGQRVTVLVNEIQYAGNYVISWNGRDINGKPVATGVYFYILKSKSHFAVKKMLLIQ